MNTHDMFKAAALLFVPLLILAGIQSHPALSLEHTTSQRTPTVGVLPTAVVRTPAAKIQPWQPRIAFQYYDRDEPTAEFLAENTDWLMMKYGTENHRQEVYAHGYNNLILQYMLAYQVLGPGPYANKRDKCKHKYTPIRNNAAWTKDFCTKVHPHESWFLHNAKGERLYGRWNNWDGTVIYSYFMNPASHGFRSFWISQVQLQQKAGWRGFFLDNVAVSYTYLRTKAADNQDGTVQEYTSDAAWQRAMIGFVTEIRQAFPGYPIWANMIETDATVDAWDPLFTYFDGFMEENFATNWVGQPFFSPNEWENMLQRSERALQKGKGVVLYSQGVQHDQARMQFGLASYLLIATSDERATFRYADSHDYLSFWWYPEYNRNLGLPKGKRYRQGEEWLRDFQCGRAIVNPRTHMGVITYHACRA